MRSYVSSLVGQETVADNTLAVHFTKPHGFSFSAGQYVDIALTSSPFHDMWGNLRTFSIVSAPFEDKLVFVMRLSDTAFKRALSVAPTGTTVALKGPAGEFFAHPDDGRPAVFLAGGVGIAPFLSILRQAEHDRLARQFYLFYSNHGPADSAYLAELSRYATNGILNLELIPTITAHSESGWWGEKGRIDPAMLRRHLGTAAHPMYYISGPSRFVNTMISVVTALDANEADMQIEDFGEF